MPKKTQQPSETRFEERFSRLEEIVSLLDRADASLDELLALYEEGVNLSKECAIILQNAEQKILTLKNGIVEEA